MKRLLLPALLAVLFPLASMAQTSYHESSSDESAAMASDESDDTTSDTTSAMNPDGTERDVASEPAESAADVSSEETRGYTAEDRAASQQAQEIAPAQQTPAQQTPAMGTAAPSKASVVEAKPETAGDLRAPSPKILDPNRRGYFQAGVGPAYGAAMHTDSAMYNIIGSYNFNLSENMTAKAFADIYLATGDVGSRLMNYGIGGEYYFSDYKFLGGKPYVGADAGLGFARNARADEGTGLTLGAGAGFKFQANNLNFDINAHYTQMTAEVGSSTPALFALRGSVTF